MKHKKRVKSRKWKVKSIGVATLLTLVFSLSTATAQTSVNATGGEATGSSGTVSYTVGQVAYQTHTGTNGSVAEGVQQPYEIYTVGINNTPHINIDVSAYPNPSTDYLQLKVYPNGNSNRVESEKLQDLSYQLYDMQGKILQHEKLTGTETQINMSNYVPATYFVRVTQGNQSIKEFKIVKR